MLFDDMILKELEEHEKFLRKQDNERLFEQANEIFEERCFLEDLAKAQKKKPKKFSEQPVPIKIRDIDLNQPLWSGD